MRSLDQRYLQRLTLSQEQGSTLKKLGEYKGKQDLFSRQTPEILESLKQVAVIESAESSNRIEGVTAPHNRVQAIVLRSTTPKDRSEQEIAGYRDVLDLLHESAANIQFSVNVVLQMHGMLHRYVVSEGGKWKMTDNDIIERFPDGTVKRIRFKCVPAVQTPQAMDDLVARYRAAMEDHNTEPLVVLPLTILDFLCIHPFSDGNGRMARLITLLLLYHLGYEVGRYISLERVIEESKETYYETLEASSMGWHEGTHDCSPWMNYFWGMLLRAYREFEERVGTIRKSRGSKTQQVRNAVGRKIVPFAISDIERECPGVSRDMIRRVLRQMRDEGSVELQGTGRGSKWRKL